MMRVGILLLTGFVLLSFKADTWKAKLIGQHDERVYSVVVSPDGEWIASASNDNRVKIWDSKTKKLVKDLMCHSVAATDVVFTSDKALMITSGNDKLIRFWDTKTWTKIGEINEHQGQVNGLALTADDKYLYSCSDDQSIVKWDVKTRSKLKKIGEHNGRVLSITLDSKNKYLVSTSGDKMTKTKGNLKLWDLETETCTYTYDVEEYAIQSACFNSSGSLVFFGGNFYDIRIIKRNDGSLFTSQEVTKFGVNSVITKGTNVYAATTYNGEIAQWTIGGEVETFAGHKQAVNRLSLLNDDLISCGSDGKVLLWENPSK